MKKVNLLNIYRKGGLIDFIKNIYIYIYVYELVGILEENP